MHRRRTIRRIGWIHPILSNHPGTIHSIIQNRPSQNSLRGKEFNYFFPTSRSDDLCLLYPSFFYGWILVVTPVMTRTEIVREPTMTKLHHAYVDPGEHSVDDSFRWGVDDFIKGTVSRDFWPLFCLCSRWLRGQTFFASIFAKTVYSTTLHKRV